MDRLLRVSSKFEKCSSVASGCMEMSEEIVMEAAVLGLTLASLVLETLTTGDVCYRLFVGETGYYITACVVDDVIVMILQPQLYMSG